MLGRRKGGGTLKSFGEHERGKSGKEFETVVREKQTEGDRLKVSLK